LYLLPVDEPPVVLPDMDKDTLRQNCEGYEDDVDRFLCEIKHGQGKITETPTGYMKYEQEMENQDQIDRQEYATKISKIIETQKEENKEMLEKYNTAKTEFENKKANDRRQKYDNKEKEQKRRADLRAPPAAPAAPIAAAPAPAAPRQWVEW
jgi:hypothetical protein